MVVSNPPRGDFGPSDETLSLRPYCSLTPEQVQAARKKRREGFTAREIADEFGVSLEDTKLALAGLRTQAKIHRRHTVNVGVTAYHALLREKAGPGEPLWQTMDRVLTELHNLRGRNS